MRKGTGLAIGAGLGALTGLAVVAVAFLGQQALGLPFIPFVFFEWLTRVLPGGVVTLGIDSMVRLITNLGLGPIDSVAKGMEQFQAIVIWLVISAIIGLVLAAWLRAQAAKANGLAAESGAKAGTVAGLVLAALVLIAMLALRQSPLSQPGTLLWMPILLLGWGTLLGLWLERGLVLESAAREPALPLQVQGPAQPPPVGVEAAADAKTGMPAHMSRRQFLLRAGGGSLLVAAIAGGLGWLLAGQKARTGAGQPLAALGASSSGTSTTNPAAASVPAAAHLPPTPAGRVSPAPGTRPEITANGDFYRIDIDLLPPQVDGPSWQLEASGLFDRPGKLKLPDLLALPAVTQPITQSCISNPIGGDLISSAYYTGVRLVDVLKQLGLQPAAKALALQSADGFYETVELADMQDPRVLLVYGMNGTSLPVEHGYPLRIYIPNRYGMKQPKWIISLRAMDHWEAGYWVERGWSQEARPQVISIIDTVAKGSIANGRVPVGGIAWAGDRGIQSVEVQVDGGTWAPATLITPPTGPLTWVLWRYDWPVVPGRHTFTVRATDGKGTLQNGQNQDTYPNGATGFQAVTGNF